MHFHQHAVNFLIHGKKHWFLQHPSGGEFSIVAIADYVSTVLPALPAAQRPLQCTQRSGDAIYVPYAWGHGILNVETSIGWATEYDTEMGGRYSRL